MRCTISACSAIPWSCVDMVCDLEVSPIFPSSGTLCPASPSLQWVPWASVPHLPSQHIPDHRYYVQLRLPTALPVVLCYSLSFHSTLPCSLSLCPVSGSLDGVSDRPAPGLLVCRYTFSSGLLTRRQIGSLKFPSCPHRHLPRSQTPVVSCLHRLILVRTAAFRSLHTVGFPSLAS